MTAAPHSFWITNRVANHFVRPVLRGPLGTRVGRHLALLRVKGRTSGRTYEFPVQYARRGREVWVVPGHPESKRWWRNLTGPGSDVELRLAGREHRGHAVAIDGSTNPGDVRRGLDVYVDQLPSAARALGVTSSEGSERRTQLDRAAEHAVIVRVLLDVGPQVD